MTKKKRILGFTDYGRGGLAYNLRFPLAHWHTQGHEVWLSAINFDGNVANADRTLYPYAERLLPYRRQNPQALPEAIARVKPDVVLSGLDLWMMQDLLRPQSQPAFKDQYSIQHVLSHESRTFVHAAFFPVDNLLPNGFVNTETEMLIGYADMPICYSQFSKEAVLKSTGLDVPCIPLPIDTSTYYPRDKVQARKRFNIADDVFVISMVATNQWRKLWGEFATVMGRVTKRHPDIRILPWAQDQRVCGGFDLQDLFYRNDLLDLIIKPQNIGNATDDDMAELYSAMDLLVLTTAAEGAGLPPLQARACGTAALVSANTANIEFAAHPIELIPSMPTNLVHGFIGPANTVTYSTNVLELEERIERLYQDRALLRTIGETGRIAMQAYTPEKIMPLWDNLLNAMVNS